MIAALFVQKNGCYWGRPGVDPWDETRDARLYAGPWPVVAHPPCARWCMLARLVEARYGLKVGDDRGCFASALQSVRRYGGVLEHPASSKAWPAFGLPRPVKGQWISTTPGEWTAEVSQAAYGHRARKLTWLFYVGPKPPDLDWTRPKTNVWVSWLSQSGKGLVVKRMGKRESSNPEGFPGHLDLPCRSLDRLLAQ